MTRQVGTLVAEHARRALLGRDAELATLDELIGRGGEAAVVYVHGFPGIGKSALVDAFIANARSQGLATVRIDCRSTEPTESGFLAAVADTVDAEAARLDAVVERLAALGGAVLALDHYEVFRLMDTWLRQTFVPALDESVRLLLAGREPPVAAWFAAGWNELFHSVSLGPIDAESAEALLQRRGLREREARRVNRVARGHPLALMLASAAVADRHDLGLADAASASVVSTLARLYLEDVDDPRTRRALEAASVVRRATQPLLHAMIPDEPPNELFERLVALPFADVGADGLLIHDAVRDAISAFLYSSDPARHREYRRFAWRELRTEVSDAAPSELWRYTADMLYLIENPIVREAFFPSGSQPLAVEPAQADDAAAIRAIAARHEPPAAVELLDAWWHEAPNAFSVVRDRDGIVTAFFVLLDNTTMLPPAVASDPVVRQWVEHLRAEGIPRGERVLGLRRWLDVEHGEAPCASQAACWLDVKRTYMELRPNLRRIYVTVRDVPTYWPVVEKLGFLPVGASAVDGEEPPYASVVLDFGPGSVDGWLARLVAIELGLDPGIDVDTAAREAVIEGERIELTALEVGVLRRLLDADERAVSRADLLEEVWGTTYTGGSNVVDAVIRSLRAKLGRHGDAVETVRGVGYRLRDRWSAQR